METILHKLNKCLLTCMLLCIVGVGRSQITYSEDFNTTNHNWELTEFLNINNNFGAPVCSGTGSVAANLFTGLYDGYTAQMVSPVIGVSNGGVVTMSYKYKLIDYDNEEAVENAANWGSFHVYYSISPTGPYTLIETVNTTNHIESATCATRTVNFTPPAGEQIYVSIYGMLGSHANDFWLYVDDVSASQGAPIVCAGLPAASTAVASNEYVCNTETIEFTLSTAYTNAGLSYKWQTSGDGVNFTDVPVGGTSLQYTATQSATTWYRAKISCGSDFIYSAPVEVVNNGMVCYCDVEFSEFAIPVTLVNFAGINNATSNIINGTPGVENFTNLPPVNILAGEEYPITLKGNTAVNDTFYIAVYFDWNHDGDLTDANESYEIGTITYSTGIDGIQLTGQIDVPDNALAGITYMRVLMIFGEFPESPCSSVNGLGVGQAEDYFINVQALAPDYVNLQWPHTMALNFGQTGTVYAQAYEPGVTEPAGQGAGITAWIGVSAENTNPATWTTWIPATYNTSASSGNNDEYMADIGTGLQAGIYYYASRFQLNGGAYAYGGTNGIWNGTTNISGVLTVTCTTPAPTADATQEFCNDATVALLEAEGDYIYWYEAEEGGEPLNITTPLTDGEVYYASQLPDAGCESTDRTAVTVELTIVPTPTGESVQVFEYTDIDMLPMIPPTAIEVVTEDEAIISYYYSLEDIANENPMSDEMILEHGHTYYITQTINDCESVPFAVTVSLVLSTDGFTAVSLKYYPNPVKDMFTIIYSENITSVSVHNILGQQVLANEFHSHEAVIDMSQLQAGIYSLKVAAANAVTVIRIIKN